MTQTPLDSVEVFIGGQRTAVHAPRPVEVQIFERGPQGIPGPQGPAGTGGGVEVPQPSPSASWIIPVPEDLGRTPNVAIYVDGEAVEADVYADSDSVSVSFPSPTSGLVVLT